MVKMRIAGKNKAPDNQGFGYWVATHKHNEHIIGKILMGAPQPVPWIRLAETSDANPITEEVELGYAFGKAHWGQGYATEACQTIVRYTFEELDLKRFINLVRRVNSASIALMKRLGFRVEDNLHPDYDTVVGILTQTDWRARCSSNSKPHPNHGYNEVSQ